VFSWVYGEKSSYESAGEAIGFLGIGQRKFAVVRAWQQRMLVVSGVDDERFVFCSGGAMLYGDSVR
jgi:hypothetical protein